MKKQSILFCVFLISLLTSLMNAQTAPALLSPVNGATNAYTNQIFTWSSVQNAVYRIQISTGSGFWWNQIDVSNITTTSYQASGLYMYTPYYWRVSATTGDGTAFSSAWQFTTGQSSQSSGVPTLVFPDNNATGIQITNTFQWNTYSGATSYRLQVSGSSSFTSNQVDVDNITATSYQVTGLYYSTNYYWRVGANTSNGIQYSDAWQFTTGLPGDSSGNPGPTLILPINASSGVPTNGTFTWQAIEGATYRIQIATSDYFGFNQVDVSGLTSPAYDASGLYILTPYYWRVNATTSAGTSDWSTTWSFTTGTGQSQTPSAPVLASPANGSTNISLDTALVWNTSSGAASYGLQVATDNQFNNLIVNTTGLTALSYNLTNLNEAVTYYWRVNAANSSGTSSWSSTWSFTTKEAVPVLTVTQPVDSLLTNQTTISVIGNVLNPLNTVKINGSAVSVNPDGSFSGNVNLSEGINVIRITAYNNSGDSVVVTRNVTLDTASPVLTITSPTDSLLTNQTSLTVIGSINEINSLVTVNGDTVSIDQSGNFTSVVNLTEGLNIITVNAVDAVGNSVFISRTVRLDTQKPVLSLVYNVVNITPDSANVVVDGTYNDSTNVTVTINGISVATMSAHSFTGYVTLLSGQNTVTTVAIDEAGNSETISIDIDWTPPILTITSPIDSLFTSQSTVAVTGNVNEINSIVTVNGDTVAVDTLGNFTTIVNLIQGFNTITILAEDAAGNTTTETRIVILSSGVLTLTIINPVDNSYINKTNLDIAGRVTGINVTLTVNSDTVDVNPDGSFTKNVNIIEGQNLFTIRAVDGSESDTIKVLTLYGDFHAPAMNVFVVIGELSDYDAIWLTPEDTLLIESKPVYIYGEVTNGVEDLVVTINQDTIVTEIYDEYCYFNKMVELNEGLNSYQVIAADRAGNTDTVNVFLFKPYTYKPHLTVNFPAPYFITDSSSVVVTGTVIDSSASVSLSINNQSVIISPSGEFSHRISLFPGNNYLIIKAVNADNNEASKTITIKRNYSVVIPPDPVQVAPAIDSTIATSIFNETEFIYKGDNPIQYDVEDNIIERSRICVIKGKVLDNSNNALPGVLITIAEHPEFGYTFSRYDGCFDMVVNGGAQSIVRYEKDNYLTVRRLLNTPWQDFVTVDSVIMIQLDPVVTEIQTADTLQAAQGSVVTDEYGTRQASMIFKPGTTATMILPDGSTTELSSINVRATEYSVGENGVKAMPAELPCTSSYTYCVELSIDEALSSGAKEVKFNKPVSFYLQNFLNFPSGMIVPTGYFDKQLNRWVPSENGLVIKVIDIVNDLANLDINGDDVADISDSLLTIGIDSLEQRKIAGLYLPGQSFWRVPITHFSAWDTNWGSGPAEDAEEPKLNTEDVNKENEKPEDDCGNSIIGIQNQTLGESIPITGTPYSLFYNSIRMPGYKKNFSLNIPLSGNSVPASLQKIILRVYVAGTENTYTYDPQTNLSHVFEWDGKDVYGREIKGKVIATVEIGYMYQTFYQTPAQLSKSFAILSGQLLTANPARQEMILWQEWKTSLGISPAPAIANSWDIDIHHLYEPNENELRFGNGSKRKVNGVEWMINRFAGTGEVGYSGDGGPADQADFYYIEGIDFGPDGSLYISSYDYRVRKVDPNGIVTTIAGSGEAGYEGDGGLAINAKFYHPQDIAVGNDGSIYIATPGIIRKIDPSGVISTVAGVNPNPDYYYHAFSGDGGPATQAELSYFLKVAIGSCNELYIADLGNNRIRKVDSDGIINTIAGNGLDPYDGGEPIDGTPATSASLGLIFQTLYAGNYLGDIEFDSFCNLYIADVIMNKIRKVDAAGTISTIAGSGEESNGNYYQNNCDNCQALSSKFCFPTSLTVATDGTLYIADTGDHRIRKVTPDGIITTMAGTTVEVGMFTPGGNSGDGGSAIAAEVGFPNSISIGPDGNIYFSDYTIIRKISKGVKNIQEGEIPIVSEDGNELYIFNSGGKHLRTVNAITNKVLYSFNYNPAGLLTSIIDPDGLTTAIERDTTGNPTSIVSPFGDLTNISLDQNNYLASVTNPNNETIYLSYTNDGLLTNLIDAKSNHKTFVYDSTGYLIKDIGPLGDSIKLARYVYPGSVEVTYTNSTGLTNYYTTSYQIKDTVVATEISADGLTTTTKYGSDGSVTVIRPDGTITKTEIKSDPQFGMEAPLTDSMIVKTKNGLKSVFSRSKTISQITGDKVTGLIDTFFVNNRINVNVYDGLNSQITSTSPMGRTSTAVLDTAWRITQTSIPGIEPVNYKYNQFGFLTETSQGVRKSTFTYDPHGRLKTITDPMLRTESFAYDSVGRVTKQVLSDLREIHYTYDANGNLTSITPPGRPAHTFDYTPVDLTNSYTPPPVTDTTITQYEYNLDKQLTKIFRPDGSIINFTYGPNCGCSSAGKPETITFDRGTQFYTYSQDDGQLSSIVTPANDTLNYSYDSFLLKGVQWKGLVNGNVNYTYNDDFLLTSQSVNGGNIINYTYDSDGLLTSAGSLSITRNAQNGLVTGTTLGNVTGAFTYNSFGEMESYTAKYNGSDIFSTAYTQDSLGRITEILETVDGSSEKYNYMYNTYGYLTEVLRNDTTISIYTYDANGNRVARTSVRDGVTQVDSGYYDDQDRMVLYGNSNYIYTRNGDLKYKVTGVDTTRYFYDSFGNLTAVIQPPQAGQTDGTFIEYIIDGQNRRIGKKVNGNIVKRWIYKDQLTPTAELDSLNNVVSVFASGYIVKNDSTYAIITDHLGSVRLVVNVVTGAFAQRIDYDEYGNVLLNTNPDFQPFGYAGGLFDDQTKLTRFGARDYDALTGRWAAKDPILFEGGSSNLYEYVINDPINYIDDNGMQIVVPLPFPIAPPVGGPGPKQSGDAIRQFINKVTEFAQDIDNFSTVGTTVALNEFLNLFSEEGESCSTDSENEHMKNKRPSTKEKHEKGKGRVKKDKPGGEKGDARRPYRRK